MDLPMISSPSRLSAASMRAESTRKEFSAALNCAEDPGVASARTGLGVESGFSAVAVVVEDGAEHCSTSPVAVAVSGTGVSRSIETFLVTPGTWHRFDNHAMSRCVATTTRNESRDVLALSGDMQTIVPACSGTLRIT